jgi:tRNA-modifying protein YgfZ
MGRDDNRGMDTAINMSGVARLGYFGCIRVAGADCASFLHAQLTNDVTNLSPDRARLAGYCSAKGRLLASFIVWKNTTDEVLLLCSADLVEATLKRLSMFVLRSKCRLSDASAEFGFFGLAGAAAKVQVGDLPVWGRIETAGTTLIRLPSPPGQTLALCAAQAGTVDAQPPGAPLNESEWRWLLLLAGLPIIEASTREVFVPQMVNLDLLAGVDFQKGCYPGQEVVARSHYRGTLKRRMFLFDCDVLATTGAEIFARQDPDQPAGVVVNAVQLTGHSGSTLLAEVKLAAYAADELHLGNAQGALLRRRPLPYAVPMPVDAAV